MQQQDVLMALNGLTTIGAGRLRRLIDEQGSALSILKDKLDNHEVQEFLDKEHELMRQHGVRFITYEDPQFPQILKDIPDCPIGIYLKGNDLLLGQDAIAVVGSRQASVYAKTIAHRMAGELAGYGIIVVSGLARGIDACAHEGCLAREGKTIGVIGCGLTHIYPKENKSLYERVASEGLIVSEYPMLARPDAFRFPWRNRLITGLSKALIVVEAAERSGALNSASCAANQGKEVWVVPGQIDHPFAIGSNRLIADGAMVALGVEDVLQSIGLQEIKTKQGLTDQEKDVNLTPEANFILSQLSLNPLHIDSIELGNRITMSQLRMLLLELELQGLLKQLPGQLYIKVNE